MCSQSCNRLGHLSDVGWIRGEWHCRASNQRIAEALARTHVLNIAPNEPHTVGQFIGHLLDSEPGLFFKMRGVDQSELVSDAMTTQTADDAMGLNQQSDLAGEDLGAIFGIDFATTPDAQSAVSSLLPSKPPRKRAGDAKSKVKTKRKTASPKKLSNPTIAKKASRKSKPTGAVASGNLKLANAAPTEKNNAPQKRIKTEVPQKGIATATTEKPKAKPTKQVAKARVVVTLKKRVAVSDKPGKAGSKQVKR